MENKNSKLTLSQEHCDILVALYNSSRDAIMTLASPDWNFTAGNPATIKMFAAKDEDDFITRPPWAYSPEFQPNGESSKIAAERMINAAMQNGSAFFEWTHKRLTGEEFFATVLLTKTTVGGKDFLQATVRDVTKRKQIELELQEKVRELREMNMIMVGREKKMIELKSKIEKLESGSIEDDEK